MLADRDADAVQRAANDLRGTAVTFDVADPDGYTRLLAFSGPPTVLCLNAGMVATSEGPVWASPPEEWRRVLDVNLGGVVNGLRAFIPAMLATGRHHRLLITASLAGLATWPGGGPYAASKHAVVTVAEQTAVALDDHPITVTLLCPALVRTGMSDVGDDPADVAASALDASERGQFVVVPAEWKRAVRDRADRLGERPAPDVAATELSGSLAVVDSHAPTRHRRRAVIVRCRPRRHPPSTSPCSYA